MTPEPSVGFDYDALGLDSAVDEVKELAPELTEEHAEQVVAWAYGLKDWMIMSLMFRRVISWVGEGNTIVETGQRSLAMIYVLRPEFLEGATLREIGAQSGITRAAIDKLTTDFRDTFGVSGPNNRSQETREKCRIAQINLRR